MLNSLTATIGRPFFGQKLPAARARELFKPYTDSASLIVEIEKNVLRFRFGIFPGYVSESKICSKTTISKVNSLHICWNLDATFTSCP